MVLDIKLLYLLNSLVGKSAVLDKIIVFLGGYLQYPLVAIFLVGLYYWHVSRPEKKRILLVTVFSPIVARLGVTELIRFLYHRPRPFIAYSDIQPLISENKWSFPSGHAAFFFAFAMAIYLYNKKWGTWFFIAAILISVSRVIAGIHYPSDIIGGAIIGLATGYFVFNYAIIFYKKRI